MSRRNQHQPALDWAIAHTTREDFRVGRRNWDLRIDLQDEHLGPEPDMHASFFFDGVAIDASCRKSRTLQLLSHPGDVA